jgi:hypothetical protein
MDYPLWTFYLNLQHNHVGWSGLSNPAYTKQLCVDFRTAVAEKLGEAYALLGFEAFHSHRGAGWIYMAQCISH